MSATTATTPTTIAATRKIWFITGCSSGIGRELALAALACGDGVIATARSEAKIQELQQRGATTVALDVTWPDERVAQVVADAAALHGGRIDVLVNNAGYSLVGSAEECSSDEIVDVFNTNVFGIYRMQRTVLPYMRAQQSGVIANVGSIAGRRAFPANGVYCTTKFAVAGLSESLQAEVAHLGIDVTCIDLGTFRTSFGNNSVVAKKSLPDSGPAIARMKDFLERRNGTQRGDPARAAAILVDALTKRGRFAGKTLPIRLALGADAAPFVKNVLERDQRELDEWLDLVAGTDHDDAASSPNLV